MVWFSRTDKRPKRRVKKHVKASAGEIGGEKELNSVIRRIHVSIEGGVVKTIRHNGPVLSTFLFEVLLRAPSLFSVVYLLDMLGVFLLSCAELIFLYFLESFSLFLFSPFNFFSFFFHFLPELFSLHKTGLFT